MKIDWEVCPRGDVPPQYAGIYVTMNRKGVIAFSKSTHRLLDLAPAVVLLYDRKNCRIGIQPSTRNSRNAYPVLVAGRSGGKKINALRLIREFGIDLPATVKFSDAEIDDDGILRLDLRTAEIPARVKNHRCNQQKRFPTTM